MNIAGMVDDTETIEQPKVDHVDQPKDHADGDQREDNV